MLIDLDDAKASLGITGTDRDGLLTSYAEAATAVIEDIVGPVDPGTRTATRDGGQPLLTVSGPIAAVTSVTVDGVTLDATLYTANLTAGIIYFGSSPTIMYWPPGVQNIVVEYTVGSDSGIPANVRLAAMELVRFWWQIGQQGNRPGWGDAPEAAEYVPSGFAVPRRVIELCAPNMRAPGIG